MSGRNPELFEFEGQRLSLAEIRAIVPYASVRTLIRHIEAGRNTRAKIASYNPKGAIRAAAARRNAQRKRDDMGRGL